MMGVLIGLLLVCAAWAVAASAMMVGDLKKRSIPASYFWLRMLLPKYLHQYGQVTRQESGHVGPLFYHFVVPVNLAVVAAFALFVAAIT
jgi:hypothetical protein